MESFVIRSVDLDPLTFLRESRLTLVCFLSSRLKLGEERTEEVGLKASATWRWEDSQEGSGKGGGGGEGIKAWQLTTTPALWSSALAAMNRLSGRIFSERLSVKEMFLVFS